MQFTNILTKWACAMMLIVSATFALFSVSVQAKELTATGLVIMNCNVVGAAPKPLLEWVSEVNTSAPRLKPGGTLKLPDGFVEALTSRRPGACRISWSDHWITSDCNLPEKEEKAEKTSWSVKCRTRELTATELVIMNCNVLGEVPKPLLEWVSEATNRYVYLSHAFGDALQELNKGTAWMRPGECRVRRSEDGFFLGCKAKEGESEEGEKLEKTSWSLKCKAKEE